MNKSQFIGSCCFLILESTVLQNYLKFEESSGDPARVQVLYERAITDFPISTDIWLGYTHYMDKTLKVFYFFCYYFFMEIICIWGETLYFLQVGSIVKNVYSRAVKNCPWVGELWVRYLLSLERGHTAEKEIASVCSTPRLNCSQHTPTLIFML